MTSRVLHLTDSGRATFAEALMRRIAARMRFIRCTCGNDQPYELGRGIPPCESCGQPFEEIEPPTRRGPPA